MTAMAATRQLAADHVLLAGNVAAPITVTISEAMEHAPPVVITHMHKILRLVLEFPLQRPLILTIPFAGLVISLQTTRQIWVGRTITEDADQSHGWLAKNWLAFGIDLSKQPHPRLSRRSSSEIIRKPLRESVSRACSVLSTMIATAGLPFG